MKPSFSHYPFGSPMPSRSFSASSYKYGFNGQEKDDEVAGAGNSNTAEYWQYDTRLGRRWNLDPRTETGISDYSCLGNNPIASTDPDGDEFDKKSQKKVDKIKAKIEARKEEVTKNIEKVNSALSSLNGDHLTPKENREKGKLEKEKIDLGNQQNELMAASTEINKMEKDNQMFHLKTSLNPFILFGGSTKYRESDHSIVMKTGLFGDYSTKGHELKHGFQFIMGEISFKEDGKTPGALSDKTDESNAYRRQYALNPNRVKSNWLGVKRYTDITPSKTAGLLHTYKKLPSKERSMATTPMYIMTTEFHK